MENAQDVVRELACSIRSFCGDCGHGSSLLLCARSSHGCERHFPFIATSHIVFCGDKSIVAADYLIDDNVRQLSRFRGEGIIFTAPHNMQ